MKSLITIALTCTLVAGCSTVTTESTLHSTAKERSETSDHTQEEPSAQIILTGIDETEISWREVSPLLCDLWETGCYEVQINGFYWKQYPGCRRCGTIKQTHVDPLTLRHGEGIGYDLQQVDEWCRKNSTIHSLISFGDEVSLPAIKGVTSIFHEYEMTFDVQKAGEHDDDVILITQYEHDRRKKALHNQDLQPNPFIWVQLYQQGERRVVDAHDYRPVVISKGGQLFFESNSITDADLVEMVKERVEKDNAAVDFSEYHIVILTPDGDTPYKRVQEVKTLIWKHGGRPGEFNTKEAQPVN